MMEAPPTDVASELRASIETILTALRAVGSGDLSQRLEQKYPESHPVGALIQSINYMTQALSEARGQSEAYVDQLATQITTIERQREAIRNLSVPIIEIWAGVLC